MKLSENQLKTLRAASRIMEKAAKGYQAHAFENADFSKSYFFNKLFGQEREHFCVAFLDNQHGLIECETLFSGTIDAAPVYPREILKRALELNSAAVIVSHNHPSGASEPSQADIMITERIRNVLDVVDIRMLDHIVVGNQCYSFAEHGRI